MGGERQVEAEGREPLSFGKRKAFSGVRDSTHLRNLSGVILEDVHEKSCGMNSFAECRIFSDEGRWIFRKFSL